VGLICKNIKKSNSKFTGMVMKMKKIEETGTIRILNTDILCLEYCARRLGITLRQAVSKAVSMLMKDYMGGTAAPITEQGKYYTYKLLNDILEFLINKYTIKINNEGEQRIAVAIQKEVIENVDRMSEWYQETANNEGTLEQFYLNRATSLDEKRTYFIRKAYTIGTLQFFEKYNIRFPEQLEQVLLNGMIEETKILEEENLPIWYKNAIKEPQVWYLLFKRNLTNEYYDRLKNADDMDMEAGKIITEINEQKEKEEREKQRKTEEIGQKKMDACSLLTRDLREKILGYEEYNKISYDTKTSWTAIIYKSDDPMAKANELLSMAQKCKTAEEVMLCLR